MTVAGGTSLGVAAAVAPADLTREGDATSVAAAQRPLLHLDAITKRWGRDKLVLADVDLTIAPGESVGLIGSNGAGKTTLLRIAAGLIAPDSGQVRVDGLDPATDRRRYQQRIGFVPAGQSGLYARLTVDFHLDYCARIMFVPAAERRARIEAAAALFELDELRDRRVDRLSMGQRQRVRLALGLVHRPSLLLLDEPENSLDERGKGLLRSALEALVAEGRTVVWCAPSADDLGVARDAVYELGGGRLERR